MDVVTSIGALRARVADWRASGETVALVPTMGALHEGHLTLVRTALARAGRAVVTIFVNPTQFAPGEDFASYPRRERADQDLLRAAGAHLLFMPSVSEMYPAGHATRVSVEGVSQTLEDEFRPGHFDGVATVVAKLLLQALPDVALFGEKDYQQLLVIRRMVRDLDIPVHVEGVATVREPDGLALSSRNAYLTAEERRIAPALHRAIRAVAQGVEAGASPEGECALARDALLREGFREVDYVAVRDAETLEPVADASRPARVLAAARLGRARLIDNVAVGARTTGGS
ncbi:MAG: pantoate--beta-alanine ligase [Gemmatimonadales bacterium]